MASMLGFPLASGPANRKRPARRTARALSGAASAIAAKSADRANHGRAHAAAVANGMSAPGHREALLRDRPPDESFTRTDTTTFLLTGGRYFVTVAGTFGEGGGTLTLVDANGDGFATFTDNGTATIDARYSTYHWTIDNVTGLSAVVKTAPYA